MDKKITFLVYDCGLYCELANALAADGKNRVLYYTPYGSAFPTYKDYASGDNFKHLEKIKYFFDYIEEADVIACFDVSNNDLISWLRENYPKKSIFGTGLSARLEDDRLGFKKWLEKVKLPVIPYMPIKGFDALREYLKKNPKKFIKTNIFRSDFETLCCDNYESVKQILTNREPLFGPHAEDVEFIVEDMIDTELETGYDGFSIDGQYVHLSVGYEHEKNLYIGKFGDKVPEILQKTLDKFSPVFKALQYRGCFSTEELLVSKEKSFFIDPCMRAPMPLGVLYSRFIKNWSEVVEKIGRGEVPKIECDFKYVGAYAFISRNAEDYFTLIQIEKGHEDDFRFQMVMQDKKGNFYSVKGLESVIVVVAAGNTTDEVFDGLKEKTQYVKAYDLDKKGMFRDIEEVKEKISKGRKFGINL